MANRWAAALAVTLALSIVTAPARASSDGGPCSDDRYDVKPAMGLEEVQQKVRGLIRCAADRWEVPGGAARAIEIGMCESRLWPWSGEWSLGVFQHAKAYWTDRVDRLLRPEWFNPQQWERLHLQDERGDAIPRAAYLARANVIVAVRMAHANGWGPWTACA